MSEHTPTPWKDAGEHSLTGYGDINHVIVGSDGKTVGSLYANCFAAPHMNELPTVEEASSNAALILNAVNGYTEATAEIQRLREVLRPFADIINMVECTTSHDYSDTDTWEVPIVFLRIARRVLAEGKSP